MSTPHCTVIIPTKNAMPRLISVLDMVVRQQTPWPFDVIVIDSGSRDGTVEYAEVQPFTRVISIDPKTFQHGRTRNEAIAASDAPFVAVITHDAQPANEHWLANLVGAIEQDDTVAGAFGRHIAYHNATSYTKRDLINHFDGFLQHPLIVSRHTDPDKYENDPGWRQFLHFYSDNNSCMRRSVWKEMPYPEVEFAEDQVWADEIIKAGHSKAYADDAVVVHSHDYNAIERLKRSFDESKNFEMMFDYKLCTSIRSGFKAIYGITRNDYHYYKSSKLRFSEFWAQIFTNIAHVSGHYLGARHEKLPIWLKKWLSLDGTLKMSR